MKQLSTISLSARTTEMIEWARDVLNRHNLKFYETQIEGLHYFVFENSDIQNIAFDTIQREAKSQKKEMDHVFKLELEAEKYAIITAIIPQNFGNNDKQMLN